ncbi:MAG: hypothetical protein B6D34_10980 [Candidatus Brocadia sp. UTAMX1]|nr:MAG: hypothetical protein B6D34_10980 [Candidatus Brocadia sp. UTAMX1]
MLHKIYLLIIIIMQKSCNQISPVKESGGRCKKLTKKEDFTQRYYREYKKKIVVAITFTLLSANTTKHPDTGDCPRMPPS